MRKKGGGMDIGGGKSWFILFDIWSWQFAQELLSTFSTSLGEVALVPSTGGVFIIDITHVVVSTTHTSTQSDGGVLLLTLQDERNIPPTTQTTRLWDRKVDGGFPGMYIYIIVLMRLFFSFLSPSVLPFPFFSAMSIREIYQFIKITNLRSFSMQKPNPSKNLFGISLILRGTWGM